VFGAQGMGFAAGIYQCENLRKGNKQQ